MKMTNHRNHFMALFPGPPGWAGARRELLDFMVQGKINRGRHWPSGWAPLHPDQSMPTSTIPPIFWQAGCPSCRPTNSVKAQMKMTKYHWNSKWIGANCSTILMHYITQHHYIILNPVKLAQSDLLRIQAMLWNITVTVTHKIQSKQYFVFAWTWRKAANQ